MKYEELSLEKKEGIAKIILNRPEARNALTPRLLREIVAALKEVDQDDSVRVVFMKGAGKDFCAGVDLKYALDALEGNPEGFRELIPLGPEVDETIESMSKPVIAAVHGNAITGGFIMAYFCDLIIATEDAHMGDTHATWGLVPGWQEPQRLARSIGIRRSKQFFLTDEIISAKEAQEIGVVWKVYPEGKLDEAIDEVGAKLCRLSKQSLCALKKQYAWMMKTDWKTVVEIDNITREGTPWITAAAFTEDAKERLRSFVEKRAKAR